MAGFLSAEARAARKEKKRLKHEAAINKAAGTQPPKFLSWRFISALFYLWYTPLLNLGYKRTIQMEDEFGLPYHLETGNTYPSFAKGLRKRMDNMKQTEKGRLKFERTEAGKIAPHLWASLFTQHGPWLFASISLQAIYNAFNFSGPVILNKIVTFLQNSDIYNTAQTVTLPAGVAVPSKPNVGQAYMFAALMFVFPLVGAIALVHSNRLAIQIQIKLRAELTSAVYRKALRLSARAKQQTETGRIVNLMSADVNNVMQFFYPMFSQLIVAPCILIAALVLLWFQIRWATFIGLAMLMLSSPATGLFVKRLTGLRRRMLLETDSRVKLMNQLLVGIRVLKLYAWEAAQEAAVMEARRRELGRLRQAIPARVGMQVLLFATPTLAAVFSFAAYGSASPNNFTPNHIFSAIAYFSIMRFPLVFLPFALVQLGNAMVSMRRLNQYLVMEERSEEVERLEGPSAHIDDGDFFWAEPPKPKEDPKVAKKKRRAWRRKRGLKGSEGNEPEALPLAVVADKAAAEESAAAIQKVELPQQRSSSDMDTAMEEEAAARAAAKLAGSSDSESDRPVPGLQAEALRNILSTKAEEQTLAEAAEKEAKQGAASWWLHDVNVAVRPGQLVAVVGRVGSGKSSLVAALLGEMERAKGRVALGGRMAYVAQQAWILNDTLRNNVLFGQPFDQARWDTVIKACSLEADLAVLPGGEETEIGEKGINLSGGQKQRISMARAAYADSDFVIMDDPLSAVDVHVGRHMFTSCIKGVLKDRTRLLVTNQLQFLPQCDHVIFMYKGRVAAQGTYEEVQHHPAVAELLAEFNSTGDAGNTRRPESTSSGADADDDASDPPEPDLDELRIEERVTEEFMGAAPRAAALSGPGLRRRPTFRVDHADPASNSGDLDSVLRPSIDGSEKGQLSQRHLGGMLSMPTFKAQRRHASGELGSEDGSVFSSQRSLGPGGSRRSLAAARDPAASRRSLGAASASQHDEEQGVASDKGKGELIIKEDQEIGQIGYKVYWYYLKAYGLVSCAALVIFWSSEQSLRILTNWWLSQWTAEEAKNQVARELNLPESNDRARYIGGYFGFTIAFVLMTTGRSCLNLYSAWGASRKVHRQSLHKLVGTHVLFFDTTPIGRILNRFSKDTDDMDYLLPQSVTELGNCLFQLLATLIFISIIQPYFLAGMVPLMGVYFIIQKFYRASYIEMQRIDATTRSPIYAHFSETLTGVETLRAYGFEERFALANEKKIDYNHKAYFSLRMADQWLSWRLDCIAACLILIVAMLAIAQRDHLSASLTALSLTEVLDVTGFLKYAVQSAAMFETRFNSVERIMAYRELPQEAPATIEATKPEDNWPTEGALSYRGVWMRYRPELPAVLKGVTFDIAAGEKVGICGRTGSGKSSLIVSLFRIVEPYRGSILMDGVDLLTLGLQEVRGRIAAIPQDPVLFSGTVRSNLDPFSKHTDAQLWEALGHVNLKDMVKDTDNGLEARVAEGGDNWSLGQRQLLCVARALLRRPRVLVADEATASVDGQTDALIQRTIRQNFQDCTCLTIAHRINTILDSNKVLVMDDGNVAEYAPPAELMSSPESEFRSMVVEAGLGAAFGAEERTADP